MIGPKRPRVEVYFTRVTWTIVCVLAVIILYFYIFPISTSEKQFKKFRSQAKLCLSYVQSQVQTKNIDPASALDRWFAIKLESGDNVAFDREGCMVFRSHRFDGQKLSAVDDPSMYVVVILWPRRVQTHPNSDSAVYFWIDDGGQVYMGSSSLFDFGN